MVFYSINYPKNIEKESPLISICFNIFIPVLILKNGDNWIHKILDLLDIGELLFQLQGKINLSSITFLIALIFPVAYFIYDLLNKKNVNVISILGFINVLLTGGIGIFGERFGLSKNWFIIKEGALPSLIGLALIKMASPLDDDIVEYADGTKATIDQMAKDVTTFLQWTAEPHLETRHKMGFRVIVYLTVLTILVYFSMKKIWSRIETKV